MDRTYNSGCGSGFVTEKKRRSGKPRVIPEPDPMCFTRGELADRISTDSKATYWAWEKDDDDETQ